MRDGGYSRAMLGMVCKPGVQVVEGTLLIELIGVADTQ